MEIIPVLDIRGGKAVAGKSGDRENYSELKSVYSDSSDPVEIAKNIPASRVYIADLDGIERGTPDLQLVKKIRRFKDVMLDAGIRDRHDLMKIVELDVDVVVGSETLNNLDAIRGFERDILFSIDIKDGKVISSFLPRDPLKSFNVLKTRGIRRFIFLNISAVGTLKSDFELLEKVEREGIEIYYGGGVRKEDLAQLKEKKIAGVLVGTALHKGMMVL
jgi:phosphoribosylformimino-5-aminoimidazole carboxamide ribotide isomerase